MFLMQTERSQRAEECREWAEDRSVMQQMFATIALGIIGKEENVGVGTKK